MTPAIRAHGDATALSACSTETTPHITGYFHLFGRERFIGRFLRGPDAPRAGLSRPSPVGDLPMYPCPRGARNVGESPRLCLRVRPHVRENAPRGTSRSKICTKIRASPPRGPRASDWPEVLEMPRGAKPTHYFSSIFLVFRELRTSKFERVCARNRFQIPVI